MQIIRHNPHKELQKIERDIDTLWDNGWSLLPTLSETSAMDLYEEDGNLVAEVKLPHFKKEEVSVRTDDGMLEVSAEHNEESEQKSKRLYYFRESSNHYFRRVTLPDGVQPDKAKATFKDSTLTVTMPMTTPSQPKSVEVK